MTCVSLFGDSFSTQGSAATHQTTQGLKRAAQRSAWLERKAHDLKCATHRTTLARGQCQRSAVSPTIGTGCFSRHSRERSREVTVIRKSDGQRNVRQGAIRPLDQPRSDFDTPCNHVAVRGNAKTLTKGTREVALGKAGDPGQFAELEPLRKSTFNVITQSAHRAWRQTTSPDRRDGWIESLARGLGRRSGCCDALRVRDGNRCDGVIPEPDRNAETVQPVRYI